MDRETGPAYEQGRGRYELAIDTDAHSRAPEENGSGQLGGATALSNTFTEVAFISALSAPGRQRRQAHGLHGQSQHV